MSEPDRRPLRYVVLHHTGYGEPHFDLMLEPDDVGPLLTWRLPAWPIVDGSAAVPLPPHRRAYLDYEGAVSGGRGHVRRLAAGTFERVAERVDKPSAAVHVVIDRRLLIFLKYSDA